MKPYYEEPNITLYNGDCLEILKQLSSESIDCAITSPPYWSLRAYQTNPQIWDEDRNCQHEWVEYHTKAKGGHTKSDNMPKVGSNKREQDGNISIRFGHNTNFCLKCGAWRGELGLEPTFQLYIKHLCDIFDEVKRVLKPTGTCWVNISDTYFGSGGAHKPEHANPGLSKSSSRGGYARGAFYGTSDKVIEDYQDYDYLCENLCGACRTAYRIGKSHSESLLVPKQDISPSLPNHKHKEAEKHHYSKQDFVQQENHSEVAIQGQERISNHADEQVLSSQPSKSSLSSSELTKNVSNQNHEAKCLLCGRSLTSYVQEFGYKTAYINDIEKRLATSNPNKLDNVSLDLAYPHYSKKSSNIQAKSLCGIPDRFKLEMIERGWICRSDIIWWKPNCMPSSVKDRFTVDYEHLFFFTKSKKYYFETQYEPHLTQENRPDGIIRNREFMYKSKLNKLYYKKSGLRASHGGTKDPDIRNPHGRNKRCVWTIPTKPFSGAHFAVFPEKLVETPIKAGCPQDGIILDLFAGSGTTGVVAKKLGRKFIGIELNQKYVDIAIKRIQNTQVSMFT